MKKVRLLTVLLLFVTVSATAQNMSTVIKTEALKMARALAAMDLETYISYTYPTLVSDNVSKQKMKQGLDSVEKFKKQFGIKIKSILVGNPSKVVTYKKVMQCTLPQTMTIEAMMGVVETENTLIGLSHDGKKWYFVDALLYKQKESKEKLPELSPDLVIPPMKKATTKPAETKN
jgi:lipopolysaccharide export system protein LptC